MRLNDPHLYQIKWEIASRYSTVVAKSESEGPSL